MKPFPVLCRQEHCQQPSVLFPAYSVCMKIYSFVHGGKPPPHPMSRQRSDSQMYTVNSMPLSVTCLLDTEIMFIWTGEETSISLTILDFHKAT